MNITFLSTNGKLKFMGMKQNFETHNGAGLGKSNKCGLGSAKSLKHKRPFKVKHDIMKYNPKPKDTSIQHITSTSTTYNIAQNITLTCGQTHLATW